MNNIMHLDHFQQEMANLVNEFQLNGASVIIIY